MVEELKFPLSWTKCPACGSEARVGEIMLKNEQEKGRVGLDAKPHLFHEQTLFADPRKPILSIPVVYSFYDVCADCGMVYCIHMEKAEARPQMGPPPGGNMRPFGFPQGNPGLS